MLRRRLSPDRGAAAKSANAAARRAANSAAWARISAAHAGDSARGAIAAAQQAYDDAMAAHNDAALAVDAYNRAFNHHVKERSEIEVSRWVFDLTRGCLQAGVDPGRVRHAGRRECHGSAAGHAGQGARSVGP
jgi:hypothetical protein